jgi:Bacterial TSP3 repeat
MRARKLITLIATLALALVALPAAAQAADRDGDGMSDAWEHRHHVSGAFADTDRDGVDNRNEYVEGTRPRDRDSDDDGRSDAREDRDGDRLSNGAEDATGNNPRDRDTDNDGIPDGKEQAGVVTAYEDGSLTIELATGGSVTAKVTDRTDVDCATEATAEGTTQAQSSHLRGPAGEGDVEDAAGAAGGGGFGCDGRREGADSVECPAGTLKVGAKIHEATLKVTSSGAEWREIEVLVPAT